MGYTFKNSEDITYYLNTKRILFGGKERDIYYFSKDKRPEHCDLPEDKVVVETTRTGLPVVKKKA